MSEIPENALRVVPLRAIHAELFADPDEIRSHGCVMAIGDDVIDSGTFGPAWIFARQVMVAEDVPEMRQFIENGVPEGCELVYVYPTRHQWDPASEGEWG